VGAASTSTPSGFWNNPKRRAELMLLLMAALITVAAYVLAALGTTAHMPDDIGPLLGVILGLSLVPHFANRWLAPGASPVMLPIVAFLNGLGYVIITRLDYHEATLQAGWTAIGVFAYVATLVLIRHSRDLERYRYLIAFASIGLLFLPLVPHFGVDIGGARLWVKVGPFTFQPVEIGKIGICIFFASYLAEKRELLSTPTTRVGNFLVLDPRPIAPLLLTWGVSILIMTAERDVGFSLLVFCVFLFMLWTATGKTSYLAIGAILFVAATFVGAHLFTQVNERIAVWIDPWKYSATTGYQLVQAQYAFGSGGLAGTGLGLGHPDVIPVVTSDFIFAAIGEEMGLLGTTIVLMAFLALIGTGLRIARAARSDFAKLVAAGLTVTIGLQTFFILAGVIRVLPLTGMALPFVAYGGSSLLANYVLVALLMRISDEGARTVAVRPPTPPPPRATAPVSPGAALAQNHPMADTGSPEGPKKATS
jgi:cell division protein FtsW (lipid II flippase)